MVRRADTGGAERDIFHRALIAAQNHIVTNAKGMFQHQRYPCNQVCHGGLRRQGNTDTGNASTCQQAGNGNAQCIQHRNARHNAYNSSEDIFKKAPHCAVGSNIQFVFCAAQQKAAHGGSHPCAPGNQADYGYLHDARQYAAVCGGVQFQRQKPQCSINKHGAQQDRCWAQVAIQNDADPLRLMWTEFFNQFARNSAVNQWGKQRQQHKKRHRGHRRDNA